MFSKNKSSHYSTLSENVKGYSVYNSSEVIYSHTKTLMNKELDNKIKEAIEIIRPQVQLDGGDLDYLGVEDYKVKIELKGACVGCPLSTVTLKGGIENFLRQKVDPKLEVVSTFLEDELDEFDDDLNG